MILMESISVVCTRPPHHISIYPIHPVPKGHPCAPRINRLNGHNGRLNEHNRRDCHYGTTRHEALSKIGPFSQIGAFQTHNWDKCTISILLQKCDTTKESFFFFYINKRFNLCNVLWVYKMFHCWNNQTIWGWFFRGLPKKSWEIEIADSSSFKRLEIGGNWNWLICDHHSLVVFADPGLTDHLQLIFSVTIVTLHDQPCNLYFDI